MKASNNRIAIAALMAHAPVLIPVIATSRADRARASIDAMTEAARRVVDAAPVVVILISPHTPRRRGGFAVWGDEWVKGSLTKFSSPDVTVALPNDQRLMERLFEEASARGVELWRLRDCELDHGAIVPLWHLQQAGWVGPVVVVGLNYPGEPGLIELGQSITAAAGCDGRSVAVVASGDMSHRLKPGSPGGYHPEACGFDQLFIECLRAGDYRRLMSLEPELQELAGEDVVDSTLVVASAVEWNSTGGEVLSYEGPFGVGYGVAILYAARDHGLLESPSDREEARLASGRLLPQIARYSIEAALRGDGWQPNFALEGILAERFGVFVTIRGRAGELRGCVGTISPRFGNTLEETWHLAREAAFRDHRFEPVRSEEIGHSRFEVSVVFPPEPICSTSELDPQRYGLVVATEDGRRGALLPALDGVGTAEEQLDIARRKGGIEEGETTTIQRFVVEKFCEEDAMAKETG